MSDYPIQLPFTLTPNAGAVEELAAERLKDAKPLSTMDTLHGKTHSDETTPDISEVPEIGVLLLVEEDGTVSVPRLHVGDTVVDVES
jgi:hypothetical protein